jgi:pectate lyase
MNEFFNTHLNGNYSFKEGCNIEIIKNKQQNEASNENKEVDKKININTSNKNISIEENTMKNYVENAKKLCEVSLIKRLLNYIKNTIYKKLKDSLDKYRGN